MKDGTLFAWTSVGDYRAYPQFVNVTRKDGRVSIAVRALEDTSGEYPIMGTYAKCIIPDEDLVQLIIALTQELDPALTRIGQARGVLDASGNVARAARAMASQPPSPKDS